MPLIQVVVVLIVIGVLLALLNKYSGEWVAASVLKIINVVVIVAIILWLLRLTGLLSGVATVPFPTR